jgi:AraC-like DNA-binding protein
MARNDSIAAPKFETAKHERHFYGLTKAIGRFGMRVFTPCVMDQPHWHIEVNFLSGGSMRYDVNGEIIDVPEGELVLFWAGIPHQLTEMRQSGSGAPRLTNIYLPVDTFLFMPHIAKLQVALLGGAIVCLPAALCGAEHLGRWYRDYRSNDVERIEVMKMELNAVLRRALTQDLIYLRPPLAEAEEGRSPSSAHIRHVIEMVRFILENLAEAITNADVAKVTGLHQNYALSLFSRTMRVPMKKFIIRMRLLRARALLMESALAIGKVAESCGFASISQFYTHFKTAYGMSPQALRIRYASMDLR